MIVDCALYQDGYRQAMSREGVLQVDLDEMEAGAFVWLGMVDPTAEELGRLAVQFGLHPLAVEDALKAHQRPKLEFYGDAAFLVLRTLAYDDPTSQVETGEVAVFIGRRYVVTVRHGRVHPLLAVRAGLEAVPERLALGPSAVLHAVLDGVVDDYLAVVRELEADADAIEQAVLVEGSSTRSSDIYMLKREVIECRNAAGPLIDPLQQLARDELDLVAAEIQPFFGDIADHALRAHDSIENLNELLTAALHVTLSQLQIRQNEDMRRISAWVALAAVPTMVAGIYGMNFEHMPELSWTWSYPVVLAALAVESVLLYRYFKRNGWL